MDEPTYQKLADSTFATIEDLFKEVDADDVDCERAGDVLTLTFKDGQKCIINTQRPTRQIWVAAGARAWHFSYDTKEERWYDDKDEAHELFTTVKTIVSDQAHLSV